MFCCLIRIKILRRTEEESGSKSSFLLTKLERRQSSGRGGCGLASFVFLFLVVGLV
jgi:hypothetical protein